MNLSEVTYESRLLEMQSWSAKERKERYQESFAAIINSVVECAICFVAMERAGDDISDVPCGLASYYKKIVAGQMLPGVLNLDGTLRQKVSSLPIQDQKNIVDGKRLALVVVDGETTSIRKVDPKTLMPEQVRQLFGRGYIRSEEEQRSWIETHKIAPTKSLETPEIEVNARGGFIVVGSVKLTRKDLIHYLSQLTT